MQENTKWVRMSLNCEESKADWGKVCGAEIWKDTLKLSTAHYRRVYGKISRPSDKRSVIDSELETYAPAEADTHGLRFHELFQNGTRWNKKGHIETIILGGLQPSERGVGGVPAHRDLWLHLCCASLNYLLPVSGNAGSQNFLLFIHRESALSVSRKASTMWALWSTIHHREMAQRGFFPVFTVHVCCMLDT